MDKKEETKGNFLYILISIGIILLVFIVGYNTGDSRNCEGIGGFVYKEIQWTQQTYNIVSECGELNGFNKPVLYYNDDVKQFYCIKKTDCTKNGCRYKEEYFPIIVQEN